MLSLISDLALINHPVHIITKYNQLSPSAFIPFCEFGGNMSAVGVKVDQFDFTACNSFQAKILNGQLCYEADLNTLSDQNNIDKELAIGFNFVMDYNEDRQVTFDNPLDKNFVGLANSIIEVNNNQLAFIYLSTIGEENIDDKEICIHLCFRASDTVRRRRIQSK